MSGTLPLVPRRPFEMVLRSFSPGAVSKAHSRRRQGRTRMGHRWGLTLRWSFPTRDAAAPLIAFLEAQQGEAETFEAPLPGYETPLGSWPGVPVVDGAANGGFALALRGLDPSVTGAVKAGDYFRLAGHAKLYIATADAASDGAGKAVLAIYPALFETPADGEAVSAASPSMRVALASGLREYPRAAPMKFGIEADMIEDPA